MALNWMKQIRKARQFSCEILLAYRKNLQNCLHSRKRDSQSKRKGLREDPEQWRCWKLYYLFKSREARVYMFTPLSSSTLQILKLCCAQSLEFTDIKEQECRHDRPQLCSIIWRAQNSPPSFVSATFSQTFITFLLFSGGYSFHLYYVGNWFMIKFTFCIIKPRRLDGDFASLMSPHIRNFSGVLSLILHWSSDFNNWTATIMHVLVFGSSREVFVALQGLSLSLNLCTSGFGLSFPCLTLYTFLLFPDWHCQLFTVFYW